jgi:muconolactone D-isomerase
MEWLVAIHVRIPDDMPADEIARLTAAERERGRALRAEGTIQRIWRIPGELRNVGVWRAGDATELHAAITSLPFGRWLDVEVTPLATHPLEAEDDGG